MSMLALSVLAGIALGLAMGLAWAIQRRLGNAGWVDVVWTGATGLIGAAVALAPLPAPAGAPAALPCPRQAIVAALIALWALRLGLHLGRRVAHGPEDVRYAGFRTEWGAAFQRRLFGLLQIQAAAAWILVLCVLLAARSPAPWPRAQDVLAILVLLVALLGEAIADRQLRRFKQDGASQAGAGPICDRGLWGWSRHPNYFFEWLHWFAYPLFAIAPGFIWGWLALIGPAFMYWLLVHVSGIPPLEQHMARRRGAPFAAYRGRVSAFFPLPPKKTLPEGSP